MITAKRIKKITGTTMGPLYQMFWFELLRRIGEFIIGIEKNNHGYKILIDVKRLRKKIKSA